MISFEKWNLFFGGYILQKLHKKYILYGPSRSLCPKLRFQNLYPFQFHQWRIYGISRSWGFIKHRSLLKNLLIWIFINYYYVLHENQVIRIDNYFWKKKYTVKNIYHSISMLLKSLLLLMHLLPCMYKYQNLQGRHT